MGAEGIRGGGEGRGDEEWIVTAPDQFPPVGVVQLVKYLGSSSNTESFRFASKMSCSVIVYRIARAKFTLPCVTPG